MEGVLTVFVGVIGYFALVNFPDDNRENWFFLTKRETRLIVARVEADRGDAHQEPFDWKKFLAAGLDLKIWGFAWIFGMSTCDPPPPKRSYKVGDLRFCCMRVLSQPKDHVQNPHPLKPHISKL
jgi:hypothetical protein